MKRTSAVLGVLLCLATVVPAQAQPAAVADLLWAITARLIIRNTNTGEAVLCHGFVATVGQDAYRR